MIINCEINYGEEVGFFTNERHFISFIMTMIENGSYITFKSDDMIIFKNQHTGIITTVSYTNEV